MFKFIFEVIIVPLVAVIAATTFVLGGLWSLGHVLLFGLLHWLTIVKCTGAFIVLCFFAIIAFGIYCECPKSLKELMIALKKVAE